VEDYFKLIEVLSALFLFVVKGCDIWGEDPKVLLPNKTTNYVLSRLRRTNYSAGLLSATAKRDCLAKTGCAPLAKSSACRLYDVCKTGSIYRTISSLAKKGCAPLAKSSACRLYDVSKTGSRSRKKGCAPLAKSSACRLYDVFFRKIESAPD
jgi:hypothetical protein